MIQSEVEKCKEAKLAFQQKFRTESSPTYMLEKYGIVGYGIGANCLVVNFKDRLHPDIPDEINGVRIEKRVTGVIKPRIGD